MRYRRGALRWFVICKVPFGNRAAAPYQRAYNFSDPQPPFLISTPTECADAAAGKKRSQLVSMCIAVLMSGICAFTVRPTQRTSLISSLYIRKVSFGTKPSLDCLSIDRDFSSRQHHRELIAISSSIIHLRVPRRIGGDESGLAISSGQWSIMRLLDLAIAQMPDLENLQRWQSTRLPGRCPWLLRATIPSQYALGSFGPETAAR